MVNKNFPTSILLIDDNENVLNSLGDLLQESNFAVSKANSDTKAFEILEKCEKYPSFVLVDQVLQDGAESGLKVVKDIRDYRPDIFIVMYTANSLIEDQQKWQAMYAGAHRYIRKFSPKELLRDVSDFIRDMRELQELTQKFKELTNERTAMASALIGLDVGTALIDREFRIWFANQQQSEIFGMSDIIGAPCWKYLYNHPVEQGPCSGCIVKATFETQTPRTRDILVKVSSGKLEWLRVNTVPIFSEGPEGEKRVIVVKESVQRLEDHVQRIDQKQRLQIIAQGIVFSGYGRARIFEAIDQNHIKCKGVAAGLNATQGRAYREKVVGFDIDILKDPYTKKVKENKKGTLFLDYEFGNQHPSIEGMELKPPWIDMPIWNKDKDEDKLVGWFGVDIVGGKKSQLKKNDIERLWQYSEEIRRALVEGPAESRVDPILREIVSIARFNLSGVNNVKEALSITIKAVNDCIPCHDIQIRLLEDNRLQLLKCLNSEFPQSQENIPEDDPDSFAAYVARGRHALYIGDYKQHEERIKKGSGLIPGRTPPAGLSLAVLPLIVEWEFLGTLRIEPKEQIDWEKSDLKYALFKLSSRAALLLRDIKTDRQVVEGNAAERELNQAFGAIHGIRGPSQAVRNYLQTIMSIHERGDLTVDKAVSLVSAAASSLSRIERLADRLMRLVGQRRKPLHDINIMEIIKSCITESEYLYPKMTFEFSVSNEAESIHVEPDEFRAVLDELITNSSRATNKEGLIKISAFSDQDTITITVQDNGPGIKADELEHIFDRWYSGFGGGTGLGLSFAKKVVEDLDGQVFAELSNPGLQIIIRIPKAAD